MEKVAALVHGCGKTAQFTVAPPEAKISPSGDFVGFFPRRNTVSSLDLGASVV